MFFSSLSLSSLELSGTTSMGFGDTRRRYIVEIALVSLEFAGDALLSLGSHRRYIVEIARRRYIGVHRVPETHCWPAIRRLSGDHSPEKHCCPSICWRYIVAPPFAGETLLSLHLLEIHCCPSGNAFQIQVAAWVGPSSVLLHYSPTSIHHFRSCVRVTWSRGSCVRVTWSRGSCARVTPA